MGIGVRLKNILKEKDITIKELSLKADIPSNTLYSITKRDNQNVRSDILQKIATALCIDVDALLYDEMQQNFIKTQDDVNDDSGLIKRYFIDLGMEGAVDLNPIFKRVENGTATPEDYRILKETFQKIPETLEGIKTISKRIMDILADYPKLNDNDAGDTNE